MQIIKNEKSGIAQIWLSNAEQQNERVMNLVECKIKELSGEKFKVAVFRSGSKDLYECTENLLHHNLTRSDSECTYGALYIHSTIIFIFFTYCLLGKDVIQYYSIKNMILNYTLHSVMVIVLRLVLNKKS